jgi:hypothetical protein
LPPPKGHFDEPAPLFTAEKLSFSLSGLAPDTDTAQTSLFFYKIKSIAGIMDSFIVYKPVKNII